MALPLESTNRMVTTSRDKDLEPDGQIDDEIDVQPFSEDQDSLSDEMLTAALEAIDAAIEKAPIETDQNSDIEENIPEMPANVPSYTNLKGVFSRACYENPITPQQIAVNENMNYFEKHFQDRTTPFVTKVLTKITSLYTDKMPKVPVANKQLTQFASSVLIYRSSEEYSQHVAKLFHARVASSVQFRCALEIFDYLRSLVVSTGARPLIDEAIKEASAKKNDRKKESSAGLGKKRYISGWCVAKMTHARKSKIRRHLYQKKIKMSRRITWQRTEISRSIDHQ